MTDRQKAFVLGYAMGYKEELAQTLMIEVGKGDYTNLMASNDYESGHQQGAFDGESMAYDLLYKDNSEFCSNAFGLDFNKSIREAMKGDGFLDPCAGPGFTQPPGYPLYLDTTATDLCEEIKNVLSEVLLSAKLGSGFVSTDVLEKIFDQIDGIEQRFVMEQVDDYYGR